MRGAGGAGAGREPRDAAARGAGWSCVGAGMAGMATVEAVLAHAEPGRGRSRWSAREPDAPYNRVLLSQVLAGRASRTSGSRCAAAVVRGARRRAAAAAPPRGASTCARASVELADGATRRLRRRSCWRPARAPWLPPVPGTRPRGRPRVPHARRRARDPRRGARARGRAVVIGGGLLGLEAARGLRERGVDVTVVHLADRLMELQLDPLAARLLERRIRALGIEVLCERRTEAVTDAGVSARRTAPTLPADLVVFATGIRPEVALARDAGLEVGRGVRRRRQPARQRAGRLGGRRVRRAPRHGLRAVGAAARAGARRGRRDRRAARRVPRRGAGDDAEGRRHRPLLRRAARPSTTRATRRCSRSTRGASATASWSSATAAWRARRCSATSATRARCAS